MVWKRLFVLTACFLLGSWILHAGTAHAQTTPITSVVTDASDGTTLPGVNIAVQGTTRGTTTDADGTYRIAVPGPDAVLVFSFVGYETQQVPVRDPDLNTTENYTFSQFGNNAFNPVAVLDFNNSEDRATRLAGNVFVELAPTDGLTVRSDFGLDLRYGDNYSFTTTSGTAAWLPSTATWPRSARRTLPTRTARWCST